MSAAIEIIDDRLSVRFTAFDQDEYQTFLKCKRLPESQTIFHPEDETYSITAPARFADMLGIERTSAGAQDLPLSPFLFDDQAAITRMAIEAKRFAIWSDCGTGKTPMGLEVAKQVVHRTGGRVLVTTMNDIVPQWIAEADKFHGSALPIHRINSRAEMREWCKNGPGQIAITNYEKWNPDGLDDQMVPEAKHLAGIILDESSRLKTGGGVQKWAIIHSCKGIEYKLSLTATPAPNDVMEFASQASFLEKMRSEGEILWTYFVRDEKNHRWTVKQHARKAFFEFMSSWSIYMRDPRKYGWRLGMTETPKPEIIVHEIDPSEEQRSRMRRIMVDPVGQMSLWDSMDKNAIQRAKLSQVAKGFAYKKGEAAGSYDRIESTKPRLVASLAAADAAEGLQVIIWTIFNAESDLLSEELEHFGVAHESISGDTGQANRLEILKRFVDGECRVLISKASMLGWGMNFQCCGSMIFSGFSDSYEQYYQAVRRAYRHGQTRSVRVHLPCVKELEEDMLDNLFRKQAEHERSIAEMEDSYIRAHGSLRSAS